MCIQCETKGIEMILNPLNLTAVKSQLPLPEPWDKLIEQKFHQDLIDRAYAYLGWVTRRGNEVEIKNSKTFLTSIGKGFVEKFNPLKFPIEKNDPWYQLKNDAVVAIEELSNMFKDRVSSVVWNSFAHLATRIDPEEKRSILSEANILPHHYGIVDTNLHAAGKVYTFMMQVQSTFFSHTGRILVHNCDCSCSLVNLGKVDGCVKYNIPDEQGMFEATQSLFTHQLAESQLLINEKLPFEFSITKEAQELLGVCVIN